MIHMIDIWSHFCVFTWHSRTLHTSTPEMQKKIAWSKCIQPLPPQYTHRTLENLAHIQCHQAPALAKSLMPHAASTESALSSFIQITTVEEEDDMACCLDTDSSRGRSFGHLSDLAAAGRLHTSAASFAAGRFNARLAPAWAEEAGACTDELADAYTLHHVLATFRDTKTAFRRIRSRVYNDLYLIPGYTARMCSPSASLRLLAVSYCKGPESG